MCKAKLQRLIETSFWSQTSKVVLQPPIFLHSQILSPLATKSKKAWNFGRWPNITLPAITTFLDFLVWSFTLYTYHGIHQHPFAHLLGEYFWVTFSLKHFWRVANVQAFHNPIGSMGLVYLPTWRPIKIDEIHVGKYIIMSLSVWELSSGAPGQEFGSWCGSHSHCKANAWNVRCWFGQSAEWRRRREFEKFHPGEGFSNGGVLRGSSPWM